MIDIENEVFTVVAKALRQKFKNIKVYGDEDKRVEATFPVVTFVETDNRTYTPSLDTRLGENHVRVVYTANIYSNLERGKKTECKAIEKEISDVMTSLGFIRTASMEVPNAQDRTIHRRTARYEAVISKDKKIYRS